MIASLNLCRAVKHDPAGLLCEGSQQVEGLVVAGLDLEDVTLDPLGSGDVAGGSSTGAFEGSAKSRCVMAPAPQVLTPSGHEHSRRIVQSSKIAGAAMGAWTTS